MLFSPSVGVSTRTRPRSPVPRLSTAERARLPHALPCPEYYELFPEDAGPTGNLVVSSPHEMLMWSFVTSPVTPDVAALRGGCIEYRTGDPTTPVQYFEFDSSSDNVYGLPVPYEQRGLEGVSALPVPS